MTITVGLRSRSLQRASSQIPRVATSLTSRSLAVLIGLWLSPVSVGWSVCGATGEAAAATTSRPRAIPEHPAAKSQSAGRTDRVPEPFEPCSLARVTGVCGPPRNVAGGLSRREYVVHRRQTTTRPVGRTPPPMGNIAALRAPAVSVSCTSPTRSSPGAVPCPACGSPAVEARAVGTRPKQNRGQITTYAMWWVRCGPALWVGRCVRTATSGNDDQQRDRPCQTPPPDWLSNVTFYNCTTRLDCCSPPAPHRFSLFHLGSHKPRQPDRAIHAHHAQRGEHTPHSISAFLVRFYS